MLKCVIYIHIFNKQKEDDPNFNFLKDFEDFDIANEDDVLEEFLGLERSKPKVNNDAVIFLSGSVLLNCY